MHQHSHLVHDKKVSLPMCTGTLLHRVLYTTRTCNFQTSTAGTSQPRPEVAREVNATTSCTTYHIPWVTRVHSPRMRYPWGKKQPTHLFNLCISTFISFMTKKSPSSCVPVHYCTVYGTLHARATSKEARPARHSPAPRWHVK